MKQHPAQSEDLIKFPGWVRNLCLILAALPFVVFLVLLFSGGDFDGSRVTGLWVSGCVTLFPLSLVLLWHNWSILLKEHSFVYTSYLGRSWEFTYKEVTYYEELTNYVIVYVGERKLHIDGFCDYQTFLHKVRGTNPACTKRPPAMKKQLFHGYIKNPVEVIVVNILLLVLGVGIGITLCCIKPMPAVDAQNTQVYEAGFEKSWSAYRHQSKATYFSFTLEDLPYEFFLSPRDFEQSSFENSVSPGDALTVVTYKDSKETSDRRLRVVALRDEQREYLTLEQYNEKNASDNQWLRRIGIGCLIFFPLFVVFFFYVIDHAPRYPRLTRLLVKERCIHCPNEHPRRSRK